MKLSPILALGALLAAGPASADALNGDVTLVQLDPSVSSILYVASPADASAQPMYKSIDGGVTWTLFETVRLADQIAPDPLDPSTLYLAATDLSSAHVLLKSTDGGATWNEITSVPASEVYALAVDPVKEGVVYAAGSGGLYKTTDGGQDWTTIDGGLDGITSETFVIQKIMVDPSHPDTVYFSLFAPTVVHRVPVSPAIPSGVYKSTDGGSTWSASALTGSTVYGVAMDSQDTSHLVACAGGQLRSTKDGGATWTTGASCDTGTSTISISSLNPERILLSRTGSTTLWVSDDGGATLSSLHDFPSGVVGGFAYSGGNIYVGTNASGLYISRNDGVSWTTYDSATVPQTLHVPADHSTIQAAIDAASDGDTVLVAPGTYYEQLDFKGKAITVKSSDGAASTILDGNGGGPIVTFDTGEGSAAVLQGFTLKDADLQADSGGPAVEMVGASPTIEDDVFIDNYDGQGFGSGGAITGSSSSAVIVRDYFADNTGLNSSQDNLSTVVMLTGGSPVVADDVFVDNSSIACAVEVDSGSSPQIYNNTLVGNSVGLAIPVTASSYATGTLFGNNLIAFNQVGVTMGLPAALGPPPFTDNLVYGDSLEDYTGVASQTGTNGNISADPMLADWADGDVHPLYGSPAIDAGDSSIIQASATDLYGQARVAVGKPGGSPIVDIGAAEFTEEAPAAADGAVDTTVDTAVSGTLSVTSAYTGQKLNLVLTSNPAHGSVRLMSGTQQFRYIPQTGFAGSDSFSFKVTDAFGLSSGTATETVTVHDIAPRAFGASIRVVGNRAYRRMLRAQAARGEVLSYSAVSNPAHGFLTIDAHTGAFTYTPAHGYRGRDGFTFQVTDQWGTSSNVATINILYY